MSQLLVLTATAVCGLTSTAIAHARYAGAQCPDPTLLIDNSAAQRVTLMCTGSGFPTRSASSLGALSDSRPHSAFRDGSWPKWAEGGFWAPDLEQIGNHYLLYYSARRRRDGRRCIGVAVSDRPDEGFRDVGAPLIDDESDGAIDPALLSGPPLLLFYKRDGNSVGAPSAIFVRRLSSDGLHLIGPRVEVLRSKAHGWERGIVEGPAPIRIGETTYLLYSGGQFYTRGYAEGEAIRTGSPLGRYRRTSPDPVLHGNVRWVGTGGASIVADGDRLLIAYASFRAGQRPLRRLLFIRELRLQDGSLRPVGRARHIPLPDV